MSDHDACKLAGLDHQPAAASAGRHAVERDDTVTYIGEESKEMAQRTELRAILDTVRDQPPTRAELERNLMFADENLKPVERRHILDSIIGEAAVIVDLYSRGANGRARQAAAEIAVEFDGHFRDDAVSDEDRRAEVDRMGPRELAQEIFGNGPLGSLDRVHRPARG